MPYHKTGQPLDPGSVFLPETPSQTAGPYVHIGLALGVAGLPQRDREIDNVMAGAQTAGQRIHIQGVVLDGNGVPVTDVLLECWQADDQGRYRTEFAFDNDFNGLGRTAPGMSQTDQNGWWSLTTIKPGQVAYPDGRLMAPHLNFMIFARGINIHLHTRMYFADEKAGNAACPFLDKVPAERQDTLVARRCEDGPDGVPVYEFIIRLQGEAETVFFDF